ncbi:MAG: HEAT repeat domain-containing protein [Desulfarculaceae bacterium]|nr:HEAT repeat domain-containing protein [Desulfarculaceae bacterium]MCF8049403.1 HEAT repeat domain-containing protein [Desulfarculaceae bacterium]MCF8099099.1 HEAT repeat domain-containing protein [Desulfarculaceae bacterium]MCF8124263.1 HEAT repeat domain-containing protein [Desulfarculaceae bacterium]
MANVEQVKHKALELGFADIGFTTAEPFEHQVKVLAERRQEYAWAKTLGLDLEAGVDPARVLPGAKSIIVLMELYFSQAFPKSLENHFGRCYLDDDRVTKDGLSLRIKAFRSFLQDQGMTVKIPWHLSHRLAAARAGMGNFGKNCLFYSNKVARGGSWVLPIALVVDEQFPPGEPSMDVGCPSWCKNACLTACPTGALKGPRKLDPRRCISYLSYYGQGLTPLELREPMGLWVYGCDRCQNVCPRNAPWLAADLPLNPRAAAKAADFELSKLLHMDAAYFKQRIWPNMFYMSEKDTWRWKMNVARVMGNTRDQRYVPELIRAFQENQDQRVRAMCAWSLGRIGGPEAEQALRAFREQAEGQVALEIGQALEGLA